MRKLISLCLIVVALIHLLPFPGVLGAEQLSGLYGVSLHDGNLTILMRHRAALLGMLGLFWLYCAFRPELHLLAIITALVSVVSFLWLAGIADQHNPAIHRVVLADRIALGCLLLAASLYFIVRRSAARVTSR